MRLAQVTFSKKRREPFFDRHPVRAIVVVLALALVATLGVLYFVHAMRWFALAAAAIVGTALVGRLLGETVWTTLGVWASERVLRVYVAWGHHRRARLAIAPCADFVPGRVRMTWESMAFASALSMLVAVSLLYVLPIEPIALPWLSLAVLSACGILTFLLVPHWAFARLGLRLWEPRRFVVTSLAESYAGWVQVSNGTLLLAAGFYGVNALAPRVPRADAYLIVGSTILVLLGLSVALFGTAAAYFRRHAERVVRLVAEDARRLGFTVVRTAFTHPADD